MTILSIFPLRNSVLFPGGILPITVGRAQSIALMLQAGPADELIGVVTQRNAEDEAPALGDLFQTGTVAQIVKLVKLEDGTYSAVLKGLSRFRVQAAVEDPRFIRASVEPLTDEGTASLDELKQRALEVIAMMPELPPAATELVATFAEAGGLADMISANIDAPLEEKQGVLDEPNVGARVSLALEFLGRVRARLENDPAQAAHSLVVLPLDGVLFPTRFLGGAADEYPWLLERAPRFFGVMARRRPGASRVEDLYPTGTLVEVYRHPDPSVGLLLRGLSRFRIAEVLDAGPPFTMRVELIEEVQPPDSPELKALSRAVLDATIDVLGIVGGAPTEERDHYRKLAETDPGMLADAVAAKVLEADVQTQHSVLASHDVLARLRLVRTLIEKRHKSLVWKGRLGRLGSFFSS